MMPLPDIISHKMRESELFSSLKNKITDTDLIDEIYDWAGYNLNLKSLLQKYLSMWRYNENRVKKMQKQVEKKWPAAYEDFIRFTEIVRANRNRQNPYIVS